MSRRALQRLLWAAIVTAVLVTIGVANAQSFSAPPRRSYADLAPDPGRWAVVGRDGVLAGGRPEHRELALLVADNVGRRILITDFSGRVLWSWTNPTGRTSRFSGPLGVRWTAPGKILATFGTGEVGQIDVATKTFDWKVDRLGGEYLRSPYDAQVLPDGRLAVVLRRNHGGMVAVYDRTSGRRVWQVRMHETHTMLYRSPSESWHTRGPSIMIGALGRIAEYTYRPGHHARLLWQRHSRWSHDLVDVDDGTFLSQDGTYVHRFRHTGGDIWRVHSHFVWRRIAVDPADPAQFVHGRRVAGQRAGAPARGRLAGPPVEPAQRRHPHRLALRSADRAARGGAPCPLTSRPPARPSSSAATPTSAGTTCRPRSPPCWPRARSPRRWWSWSTTTRVSSNDSVRRSPR